ncbi:hypothetical protein ACKF11_13410 [Methylobacillus sp. Pita2]
MPIPKRSQVNILSEGAMSILVPVGTENQVIRFSIWIYFGEIRIGVGIPSSLVQSTEVSEEVSRCFDGNPCHREVDGDKEHFFDWIFNQSGMADPAFMAESFGNPGTAALLADAVGNVLTHIYMATMHSLITRGGMVVSKTAGLIKESDAKRIVINIETSKDGAIDEAAKGLLGLGLAVEKIYSPSPNRSVVILKTEQFNDERKVAINNVLAMCECSGDFLEDEEHKAG